MFKAFMVFYISGVISGCEFIAVLWAYLMKDTDDPRFKRDQKFSMPLV
jgi:hypothetical protein